jgi:hypothetical protein
MSRLIQSAVLIAVLAFTGCTRNPAPNTNHQAALTGTLPHNPLAWRVITSCTNDRDATMSTVYGNDLAVEHARTSADRAYPAGSILALVTWEQRDDPHWFGAKIPSTVKSVEFVTIPSSPKQSAAYEVYQGTPLEKVSLTDKAIISARTDYILGQHASVMP